MNKNRIFDKRDCLLDLAEKSFASAGLRSVTIADICQEAGISKKTFYGMFRHKNELVNEIVGRVLQRTIAKLRLETDISDHPANALVQIWQNVIDIATIKGIFAEGMLRYFPEAKERFQTFKKDVLLEIFKDNFRKGLAKGLYRQDLNSRTVALLQLSYLEVIMKPDSYLDRQRMTEALDVLLNGIAAIPVS